MFDDRRKFIRFDIPLSVEFKPSQELPVYLKGTTKNFSREGLGVVSENFVFEPNTTLELRLKLPTKEAYISILGNVIWKRQINDKWQAGLKFREIDKAAKGEILECAYNKWLDRLRSQR